MSKTHILRRKACNVGSEAESNVKLVVELPSGASYVSSSGDGFYDHRSKIWTIPSIAAGSCAYLNINYIGESAVPNTYYGSYPYGCTGCGDVIHNGNCCDPNTFSPTPTASVTSKSNSCVTGVVNRGGVPCNNCCETQYKIVEGSETNLERIELNQKTGEYCAHLDNKTLDWSFQYEVYCVKCAYGSYDETYGPFGPATISGGPQFVCEDIVTCIDVNVADSDSIDFGITGTGASGDPYIITGDVIRDPEADNILQITADGLYVPREVANISYNSDTDTITFVDAAGNTTTLNLAGGDGSGGVLQITNGVTAFGVEPGNPSDNTLTFEAGGDLSVASDGANNKITYSFTETASTMTDNGDGTYTYVDETGASTVIDTTGAATFFREEFKELTTGNTVTVTAPPATADTYAAARVQVFRNGILASTNEYSISGNDFIFTESFGFTDADSDPALSNGESVIIQLF